ncbi:MAG: iron ABC transporter substrate-binding protein [Chloroflexi bacterium]|nr:iron ABC transporter substrate-binding protein [Chloroflexota bacterium]
MSLVQRFLKQKVFLLVVLMAAAAGALAACSGDDDGGEKTLVVYSGREEALVGAAIEAFEKQTGIKVQVRYGSTAAIAAQILEEGGNSPADVVFLQDVGGLGAVSKAGRLQALDKGLLDRVDPKYRSAKGEWVGTTGRVRVVVYNKQKIVPERDLPKSILDFTDPKWKGKIGWAPTNASLQAFVTALRVSRGDAAAQAWLEGIKANNPKAYGNNTSVVEAVASGEVEVGFVNHYYLHALIAQKGPSYNAANQYYSDDIGGLVNVAGAGILKGAKHKEEAARFLEYLLSGEGQTYFALRTNEFPLVSGVPQPPGVPPIATLRPPQVDLSRLEDLEATLVLMRRVGVLS